MNDIGLILLITGLGFHLMALDRRLDRAAPSLPFTVAENRHRLIGGLCGVAALITVVLS